MSADQTIDHGNSTVARLLVIDDDVIQRTIISKIGTQSGYETASAASFLEANRLLTEQSFDCVTLDLSLGEQSGVLLLHTMVETNNRVPVIIVSGAEEHILESTGRIARSLGLDAQILKKPLKLAELRESLVHKREGIVATRGINQHYQWVRDRAGG
jgi:DNA-binding response OmpR family regulator